MATVASGIDETSNVVQLNGFFGKRFYFYNLFSQSAPLPVYLFNLCLYLSIYSFLSHYFSALNLFQGFSCPVDKLLNLSREFTRAVYFWKAKLEFVSRQRNFPTKPV